MLAAGPAQSAPNVDHLADLVVGLFAPLARPMMVWLPHSGHRRGSVPAGTWSPPDRSCFPLLAVR